MRIDATVALTSLFSLASLCPSASAKMPPPVSLQVRVAQGETVVVGKVTAIEPRSVHGKQHQDSTELTEYQIAVVKVDEALFNGKGLTHVKVGFIPNAYVSLKKGDEVCVFPQMNAGGQFLEVNYANLLRRDQSSFAEDMELVRKCARLMSNPMEGMKSKDEKERILTAGLLITHYRNRFRPGDEKPIDSAQSKVILQTLLNADWSVRDPIDHRLAPAYLMGQLGATPRDGWVQPEKYLEYTPAAKKWLKENAEKFVIRRIVNPNSKK